MACLGLEDIQLPSLDPLYDDDWLGSLDISKPVRCPAPQPAARSYPSQSASLPVPIGRGQAFGSLGGQPTKVEYSSLESTQTILGSGPTEESLLGAAATTMDGENFAGSALYPFSQVTYQEPLQGHSHALQQPPLLDLDDLLLGQRPSFLCDHDHELDVLAADPLVAAAPFASFHQPLPPQQHYHHSAADWSAEPQPAATSLPMHITRGAAQQQWGWQQQQQLLWEEQGSTLLPGYHTAAVGQDWGACVGGQDSAQQAQQARRAALEQCVHKGLPAFMQVHPGSVGGHPAAVLVDAHGLPGGGAGLEGDQQGEDSEDATEGSDFTMQRAASLLNTPTSPKFGSYMEVHASRHEKQGCAASQGERHAGTSLRRVSSTRSTGSASRSPSSMRLRVVMKQQHSAQHQVQQHQGEGPPPGTAGASRRPRRAAALRTLAGRGSYGNAYYDGGDEEFDAHGEEGGYASGGDGHSPKSLSPSGGGSPLQQPAAAMQPAGKKKHNPWSVEETEALIEGVHLVGVGKWAEIKKLPLPAVSGVLMARSAVDLKDKWRNLTRVARLPKSALKSRLAKGGSDTPLELVLAVKEILECGRADHREWR